MYNKLQVLKPVPYTHSWRFKEYLNFTFHERELRMEELMTSVKNTLNHPLVGNVYIFYQDPILIPYMTREGVTNSDRITFVPNMEDTMATLFRYANEYLEGHVVTVMNADVYPDEGFEKLDLEHFKKNKLMYGLSR